MVEAFAVGKQSSCVVVAVTVHVLAIEDPFYHLFSQINIKNLSPRFVNLLYGIEFCSHVNLYLSRSFFSQALTGTPQILLCPIQKKLALEISRSFLTWAWVDSMVDLQFSLLSMSLLQFAGSPIVLW